MCKLHISALVMHTRVQDKACTYVCLWKHELLIMMPRICVICRLMHSSGTLRIYLLFCPLSIFWFVLGKNDFFFLLFFLFRSTNPVHPCLMTHSLLLHTKHPFNSLVVKTLSPSLGHKVIVFISLGVRPWGSSTDKLAVVLNEQLRQGNINLGA